MVVKVKDKSEKTRQGKNNDRLKKFILRGERNVTCHDGVLWKKKQHIFQIVIWG